MNQKLLPQPDHGHYANCASRKKQIEKNSSIMLYITLSLCLFMIFLTFVGVRLGILSVLPSLASNGGCNYSVFLAFHWLEIIGIGVLAFLNFQVNKFFGIPVLIFYILFSMSPIFCGCSCQRDLVPLLLGLPGIAVSWRAIWDYNDQCQLERTEGYPYFSAFYADHTENRRARIEEHYRREVMKKAMNAETEIRTVPVPPKTNTAPQEPKGVMSDLFMPTLEPAPEPERSVFDEPETNFSYADGSTDDGSSVFDDDDDSLLPPGTAPVKRQEEPKISREKSPEKEEKPAASSAMMLKKMPDGRLKLVPKDEAAETETVQEIKPEIKPESRPVEKPEIKAPEEKKPKASKAKPVVTEKRKPTPEPAVRPVEKKETKPAKQQTSSLFDDDYELPSIKPLYFTRMEEEQKKNQEK